MSEYIVQTRRLTKHYGGVKALTEVDLSFKPGLIHALVGENGAGKSTLIRILSGIEPPTSGEVSFEGGLVEEFSPHAAHDRGISTVYQEPMQMGLMTIEENIYVGRYEKNRLGFVDYRAPPPQGDGADGRNRHPPAAPGGGRGTERGQAADGGDPQGALLPLPLHHLRRADRLAHPPRSATTSSRSSGG